MAVLAIGRRCLMADPHLEKGQMMTRRRSGCSPDWRRSSSFLVIGTVLNTFAHQPTKIAAIETRWRGTQPREGVLFGCVPKPIDMPSRSTSWARA
jgi:hypothetical protein